MRTSVFICLLLASVIYTQAAGAPQVTQLDLIKAVNFLRRQPQAFSTWVGGYIKVHGKGVSGDLDCFQDAQKAIHALKPLTANLPENFGADIVQSAHAKLMLSTNKLQQSTGTQVYDALCKVGTFEGSWCTSQLVSHIQNVKRPSANEFVLLWYADCNGNDKSHPNRDVLVSTNFNAIGCGVAYDNDDTYASCVFTNNFHARDLSITELQGANIENSAGGKAVPYNGNPENMHTATTKAASVFKFTQAFDGKDEIAPDANNGPLGDQKDDKSVRCPNWINPNLRTKLVKDWRVVEGTCTRGKDAFANGHLHGNMPFAKAKHCYQRLLWCGENEKGQSHGKLWAKDSEYKTYDQAQGIDPSKDKLGPVRDDESQKCPEFISPSLRKGLVQDWYQISGHCARGKDGFNATTGFDDVKPWAHKGKCYQRLTWCSTTGNVYRKDSEYKTYNEWINGK